MNVSGRMDKLDGRVRNLHNTAAEKPDPLSRSLWELRSEIRAMTDMEAAEQAERLGISVSDVRRMI